MELKRRKIDMGKVRSFELVVESLEEYQFFNNVGNDLKSYLWEFAEYALGLTDIKPNKEDYGVE